MTVYVRESSFTRVTLGFVLVGCNCTIFHCEVEPGQIAIVSEFLLTGCAKNLVLAITSVAKTARFEEILLC